MVLPLSAPPRRERVRFLSKSGRRSTGGVQCSNCWRFGSTSASLLGLRRRTNEPRGLTGACVRSTWHLSDSVYRTRHPRSSIRLDDGSGRGPFCYLLDGCRIPARRILALLDLYS